MKNNTLATILSLIALLGVSTLFIINQTSSKTNEQSLNIAFIDTDSIMTHYQYVDEMIENLTAETAIAEEELLNKQKNFEQKVANYQNKMSKNMLSIKKAQETEQLLMQEQQQIIQLRNQLGDQLARKEAEMNYTLLDTVQQFLLRYNKDNRYDYILSFKKNSGDILYGNHKHDIGNEVIKLMNEEYDKRKTASTEK